MAEPALVSVIMPFLNPDRGFMQEAVESVLMQDYRPLEMLFIDDGSSQRFDDFIGSWCTDDSVVTRLLFHENRQNRGCSASRNLGIRESTGKYIAFLDADDVWMPGKIREQCAIMEGDSSLAMAFGLTRYWFTWKNTRTADSQDFMPRAGFADRVVFEPPDYVAGMLRGRFLVPTPSNLMARREAVLNCGGFEEEFTDLYEDQVLIAKIALFHRVCAVPKLWDKYRQHGNSMMARIGTYKNESKAREKFISWLDHFCQESGLQFSEVTEAIAKDRWLATSTWARTGSKSYRLIRWAKKWLLRIEEWTIPATIRSRYWGGRA